MFISPDFVYNFLSSPTFLICYLCCAPKGYSRDSLSTCIEKGNKAWRPQVHITTCRFFTNFFLFRKFVVRNTMSPFSGILYSKNCHWTLSQLHKIQQLIQTFPSLRFLSHGSASISCTLWVKLVIFVLDRNINLHDGLIEPIACKRRRCQLLKKSAST